MLRELTELDLNIADNSMDTCFQFVERPNDNKITVRIKVYNKLQQMIQSKTSWMAVGSNLQHIFYPEFLMRGKILEACDLGLTRIEVSFYSSCKEVEQELVNEDCILEAGSLISDIKDVFNLVDGIIYSIPTCEMLSCIQDGCRSNQLYFEQSLICLMVYAKNEKIGSYFGFFQDISKTHSHDTKKFLAA